MHSRRSPEELARDLKIAFVILRNLWLQGERPLAGEALLAEHMDITLMYATRLYRLMRLLGLRGRLSFCIEVDPDQFDFLAAVKTQVATLEVSGVEVVSPIAYSFFPRRGDTWCYMANGLAYRFSPTPVLDRVRLQPPLPFDRVFKVEPCSAVREISQAVFIYLARRRVLILLSRKYGG
ncbi:MAG TPA: hypothetical protein VFT87_04895 [Candidatus Saccharimonadales bacterium]|nr:hypothetical protein [Candidatus Saccharimonadales bacterium]